MPATNDVSYLIIFFQWLLVFIYFPLANISQWIPLVIITIFIYVELLSWKTALNTFKKQISAVSISAILSTVSTSLIMYIFYFATLYDLFGSVKDSKNELIEGVWAHVYFSTVTMTTLGYGNLVPYGTLSEVLVSIQAVMGFIIFAILAGIFSSIVLDRIRD